MKKYEVWIVQKWGKFAYVSVQANTIKEAKQIALASDIDWQEPSDNIDVVREVVEIKPQHIIPPCLQEITAGS